MGIPSGSKIKDASADTLYDVLILGAGPAGLTAAVYVMRKGLQAAIITNNIGGQVIETAGIENYMGTLSTNSLSRSCSSPSASNRAYR
jgi:alkyl hydroperoxide reductase subunit F